MRIQTCAKVLLLGLPLIACVNARASADSHVLSGRMTWWQRVVGSWLCEVSLEPTQSRSAQKGLTVAKGSVAPGNVFHWAEMGPGFQVEQYDGYSATEKAWWETQADSTGYATLLRSSDGLLYDQVSVPSSIEGDRSIYREVYSLRPGGTFYEEVRRRVGGSWLLDSEYSCRRTTSASSTAGRAVELSPIGKAR